MTDNVKDNAVTGESLVLLNDDFDRKKPAWWEIGGRNGIRPSEAYGYKDLKEAFSAMGALYNMALTPLKTTYNDVEFLVPDRFAIVREPSLGDTEPKAFEVVSGVYKLIQNERYAEILQPVCDVYKLATVGILGEGERIFVTFEVNDFTINGDPFKGYLFCNIHHTGKAGTRIGYSTVREVCQNTFQYAEETSVETITVAHKGNAEDMLKLRCTIEHEVNLQRASTQKFFERCAEIKMNQESLANALDYTFNPNEKSKVADMVAVAPSVLNHDWAQSLFDNAGKAMSALQKAAIMHKVEVAGRYTQFNDEFPQFANTAYAYINSVTNYADWPSEARSNTPVAALSGYRSQWKVKAARWINNQ
jgi:hypothetical protein